MNAPQSEAYRNLERLAEFLTRLEEHPEFLNPEWVSQQSQTTA